MVFPEVTKRFVYLEMDEESSEPNWKVVGERRVCRDVHISLWKEILHEDGLTVNAATVSSGRKISLHSLSSPSHK